MFLFIQHLGEFLVEKRPLKTSLYETYDCWNSAKKRANCANKGGCQETQPWPSDTNINDEHLRILFLSLVLSYSLVVFHLFGFSFLFFTKYCRRRPMLMPLVALINCDSGPRNKPLHLNTEQPTVRYSLYLVLMSLSKASLYSFLICFTSFFLSPLLLS